MDGISRQLSVSLLLFLIFLGTGAISAQEPFFSFVDDLLGEGRQRDPFEERIETDRHDFTQSTQTVGRGVAQIESGYSYFYKDQEGEIENAHTAPEMLLRLGISDDIEFRVRYNYVWLFEEGAHESGAEDLRLGLKLRATEQAGWIPESAVELLMTVPTGGDVFTTEKVSPGLDYIYAWRLGRKAKLYGSSGVGARGLADFGILPDDPVNDQFTVFSQSVALGYELTDRSTFYSEFFGLFTRGHGQDPNPVFFNIGVDYYLSDNAVIDLRFGKGLNDDADDLFAGVGGAIRF